MKTSIMRTLEFDAAHRVMNHESKCANMHGHRYKVEIHARGDLDPIGRVIDFSALKARIGGWLDTHWDHTTILHKDDPSAQAWYDCVIPANKPIYLMPENPTAENMAQYLLDKCRDELMLGTGIEVWKVVVWETPNCKAEVELG